MKRFTYLTIFAAVALLFAACEKTPDVTPEISATPSTIVFDGNGETVNVAVSVTGSSSWSYSGTPEWVSVAVDGNSMALTAEANLTDSDRTGTMVLTAGEAEFTLELSQAKGSKYPGFTELTKAEIEYAGTMYQLPIFNFPDCEGGLYIITLSSEDNRYRMEIHLFTEAYASEEEVTLPAGEYKPGDDFITMKDNIIYGKPMTWMKGGTYEIVDEEGAEEFSGGTRLSVTTGDLEEDYFMSDGTITISYDENGAICIKTDFKDSEGNDQKYYYEGECELLLDGAFYPSAGKYDPTKVAMVSCSYNGDTEDGTHTSLNVSMMAEDESMTTIELAAPKTDYASLDFVGSYSTEEGSIIPGSSVEIAPGLVLPSGTGIMFPDFTSFVADGFCALIVEKNADGTYKITAMLTSATDPNASYLYMIDSTEVYFSDDTATGGGDDDED